MLVKDIPKDMAEQLIKAITDLRPDMKAEIIVEDFNLYKLGFTTYIPCTVSVDATDDEILDLLDEVEQMEIDAWNFSDSELKDPEIAKEQRELEARYARYAVIEGWLRG